MPASEETKDAVAKVGFAAFMAAAMGPVGIIIAALSVGISNAIDGDAGRATSEDLSRDRVEAERQWLAEDRAFRERLRADRRRWLADGADPDTKPAGPSKAEAAGRWWRRLWARMVVFADDFKRGFRDGWRAAKDARARGADWRETARTRPDKPEADDLDWSDFDEPTEDPDLVPDPKGDAATLTDRQCTNPNPHGGHIWGTAVQWFRCPGGEERPHRPGPDVPLCHTCGEPFDDHIKTDLGGPEPVMACPKSLNEGEEPMTTTNGPTTGESNVSVLRQMLQRIGGVITRVEAGVDDLNALADSLAAQVREATEFATRTGQIAATKVALDSANAVVAKLKALVAQASEAAVEAVEQVATARASLRVAEAAEDTLTQAGGTGEAIATARSA